MYAHAHATRGIRSYVALHVHRPGAGLALALGLFYPGVYRRYKF